MPKGSLTPTTFEVNIEQMSQFVSDFRYPFKSWLLFAPHVFYGTQ